MRQLILRVFGYLCPCIISACSPAPRSECSVKQLKALAHRLKTQRTGEIVPLVLPGLQEACGTALPAIAGRYALNAAERRRAGNWERDPKAQRLVRRACPSIDTLAGQLAQAPWHQRWVVAHRLCGFNRFDPRQGSSGVVGSTGLVTWGMHQWLLDLGLPPKHANSITHGLIQVERWNVEVGLRSEVSLVETRGDTYRPGPTLQVSTNGISLSTHSESRPLNEIHSLEQDLRQAASQWQIAQPGDYVPRLGLMSDEKTPFSVLQRLLNLGVRSGFSDFDFVVQASAYQVESIPVKLNSEHDTSATTVVRLVVDSQGNLRLQGKFGKSGSALILESTKLGRETFIARVAAELEADPTLRHLEVSASPGTDTQTLLQAITAIRGYDCRPLTRRPSCRISELSLRTTP